MMVLVVMAAAALGGAMAPGPGERIDVRLSDTVILPHAAGSQPAQVNARQGEPMWSADLGIEHAAKLGQTINVSAGGMTQVFGPDSPLWRAEPVGGRIDGQPFGGRLYCGVRQRKGAADPREQFELIFRTVAWDGATPRLCLYDSDDDGRFDHAVAAGRVKSGPTSVPITPVAFTELADVRVPGATVEVRTARNPLVGATMIGIEGYLNGRPVGSDGLNLVFPGTDKPRGFRQWTMVPKGAFPIPVSFGGLAFTILGFDPATKSVSARIDQGFYRSAVTFDQRTEFVFY